jgi:hypothetical protein
MKTNIKRKAITLLLNFWLVPFVLIVVFIAYLAG